MTEVGDLRLVPGRAKRAERFVARRMATVVFSLSFYTVAAAQGRTDVVTLANGDRSHR